MDLLKECLNDLLYVVITVVLPILVNYAVKVAKELINTKNKEYESELIADAESIVEKIVIQTMQTYVDAIKNDKEQTFTKENGVTAYNRAANTAKIMLTQEVQDLIKTKYNDLDAWLRTMIENSVRENKTDDIK